jgi:hypothetical protein
VRGFICFSLSLFSANTFHGISARHFQRLPSDGDKGEEEREKHGDDDCPPGGTDAIWEKF